MLWVGVNPPLPLVLLRTGIVDSRALGIVGVAGESAERGCRIGCVGYVLLGLALFGLLFGLVTFLYGRRQERRLLFST